jgi:hypothetical protein
MPRHPPEIPGGNEKSGKAPGTSQKEKNEMSAGGPQKRPPEKTKSHTHLKYDPWQKTKRTEDLLSRASGKGSPAQYSKGE